MSSLSKEVRHNIQAVSVCSTSSTVIPVDEDGNPLTDAIMWMDTRAKKEMKVINATKHPVLEYSGGRRLSGMDDPQGIVDQKQSAGYLC